MLGRWDTEVSPISWLGLIRHSRGSAAECLVTSSPTRTYFLAPISLAGFGRRNNIAKLPNFELLDSKIWIHCHDNPKLRES